MQDQNGNPIAVTDISIQQDDAPDNATEQQFDANDPQEQYLTLYSGQPQEYYNVSVTWADGSQYLAQLPDYDQGTSVQVTGPNQQPTS